MSKISKLISRKIKLLNESNGDSSYKDTKSPNYDRQMAEDALYHVIGPLTDNPKWVGSWSSKSAPVPDFVPNGPAARWTPEEVFIAFAGDPTFLDQPEKLSTRSPYYGRSGAPLYRLAKQVASKYAGKLSKKAQFENMKDAYGLGSIVVSKLMHPGYDESRSPFISFIFRTVEGAMEHGTGGSQESIMASGGVSKGHGVEGSSRREATAGLRGLKAVLASKDPEDVMNMANQVKGDYRFKKSHDKNPDNPFGGFSSRYYDVVSRYAEALKDGNEDRIDAAVNQINQLLGEIEESETYIPGMSTGSEAIKSARGQKVGVGSLDEPIPGADDGSSMAGQVEDRESSDSMLDPETVKYVLETILTQDIGKTIKNMPKYRQMAVDISNEIGLGYKEGESIGGPLTVNEFRYLLRTLGPVAADYPGKGNMRERTDIPRDGLIKGEKAYWWKAGEDPEIEPIPATKGIWNSIWSRSGYQIMSQTDIAREMTQETKEFKQLNIPTGRDLKVKTDKTGRTYEEVTTKVAVNTALQKARLKLSLVVRMEGLNESNDVDNLIIIETAIAMIRRIDRAIFETSPNKYVKQQMKKLPSRTQRTIKPFVS